MGRFEKVKEILEQAVGGQDIVAHSNFWRNCTRDKFVALKVFNRPLLARKPDGRFDEKESNLIKALEGTAPFGSDTGTRNAYFRRMPAGLPKLSSENVEFIRKWIKDGCPED